jgi:hypothetical protein
VGPKRLAGLKSHDFHVILEQILPVIVRNLMIVGPRTAIIRLGRCFSRICAKVVDQNEIDNLRLYVAETMCMLERWFPPSFFDISMHLLVHLVDELEVIGPVATRWCYPIERFFVSAERLCSESFEAGGLHGNGVHLGCISWVHH